MVEFATLSTIRSLFRRLNISRFGTGAARNMDDNVFVYDFKPWLHLGPDTNKRVNKRVNKKTLLFNNPSTGLHVSRIAAAVEGFTVYTSTPWTELGQCFNKFVHGVFVARVFRAMNGIASMVLIRGDYDFGQKDGGFVRCLMFFGQSVCLICLAWVNDFIS